MKPSEPEPPKLTDAERGGRAVRAARQHFRKVRDPRLPKGKRHRLVDILVIALLAILCNCDDADEIADWAELHHVWLSEWFDLSHGTPSQDTLLRVFASLNPASFTKALMSWLGSLRPLVAKHIAVDGKTLRGSLDAANGKRAIHIVNAWLREAGLVLGQVKTSDKSNEIKAIPELLELLDIEGCTVSIDAGGCHRTIAAQIVEQKGDYLLAVKDNQPTLHQDLMRLFAEASDDRRRSRDELARPEVKRVHDTDKGHGRIEERVVSVCHQLDWLTTVEQWKGLRGAVLIESSRIDAVTGETKTERRYYITSAPSLTPQRALALTRGHWAVENNLHWVLDVVFGEDRSRIRTQRAAENFGALRRLALSLLTAAQPPKKGMSLKRRRQYCAHSRDYLRTVLAHP